MSGSKQRVRTDTGLTHPFRDQPGRLPDRRDRADRRARARHAEHAPLPHVPRAEPSFLARSMTPSPPTSACPVNGPSNEPPRRCAPVGEGGDEVTDRRPEGHRRHECLDVAASQQESARHGGFAGPDYLGDMTEGSAMWNSLRTDARDGLTATCRADRYDASSVSCSAAIRASLTRE